MNADSSSPGEQIYSTPQTLALIIGVLTVSFPSGLYWQLGSSLFGQHPLIKVFVISGVGGLQEYARQRRSLSLI